MNTGNTFSNLGTGSQYASSGTQHVNSGGGSQYNANTIAFHQHNQHNDASLLADLRVTDPRDDKKRIQDTKGGLLTDSYVWVLQNPDFCQWRDDKDQRLLWVKGDPGKGKTMILCGIINELEATRAPGKPLSYFFCQATDERLNTATAVLRGLIFMLLDQDRSLVSYIKKKYDQAGKALFQDINAWQVMSEIFKDMLRDSKLQGIYLLVDALDECSNGLDQLLDLIVETSQSTSAKWLVSSRNWWQIEEQLHTVAQRLSLEVNASSVSAAVDSYIMFKVSHLSKLKGYRDDTAREVRQYLSSNADGTFLWVALVCQALKKTHRKNALQKIKSFPPGLDAFYERMMQQIDEEEDTELCRQILGLVATTYRPLSLAESAILIEKCHGLADDLESLQDTIGLCGSFLTIREDKIYFVHQSAKDFLMDEAYSAFNQILPSGIAYQHHDIFSRSLEVLSKTLKRDMYELRAPGSSIEELSPPDPDPLASLEYSSTHWVDHLEYSDLAEVSVRGDLLDNGSVHTFLKSHYLYWLEAQSLLQGMPQAVLAIQKLQTLVASLETQLAELVRDACRFVLSYKQCIESFPLQLYTAALLFSPTRSVVRQLFQAEAPAWITMITKGDVDWNACQQTLEGHSDYVRSVAFSPDGRQLASGSDDGTVKLWDTATGQCQQTLKGHSDYVRSVAFSPDGRQLASGSDDSTVKLWHTATGQCQQTLERHSRIVNSVAFSPDGRQLASGSGDHTVKLWDTATGQCQQTLEGHSSSVYSVAFSPDGRQLASGSHDHTVKLWDTATGQCQQTLEGHSGLENVFEVAIQEPTGDLMGQRHILSQQDVWIKNRSQNIVWLPPEYRASSYAENGSKIAVGCLSGRVLLLCFKSEYLQL